MNLLKKVAIKQVLGYFAAGTTKRTSEIVDSQGYDGVMFIASLGTIINAGTVDVFVEQDEDNAITDMARLAGQTALTVTSAMAALTQSCIVVDVYRPKERYLQCNITPASQNAVVLGIVAVCYSGRKTPVTQKATDLDAVLKSTQLTEPAYA
jgi:hypothetical protein